MATFSSKKLSEVQASLVHGDNGSGTPKGMSAGGNVEIRTGDNGATNINISSAMVSLGKATNDVGTSQSVSLSVRKTDGKSGNIWGGNIVSHNSDAVEGGQVMLKDPADANYNDLQKNSFVIDNYKDGTTKTMRIFSDDNSDITKFITLQKKANEPLVGIGDFGNPQAPLHVNASYMKLGSTVFNQSPNYWYVNSNTANTNNGPKGSDTNDGTSFNSPFATLDKALDMCSPFGENTVFLHGGTASSATDYKITSRSFYGGGIKIIALDPATGQHPATTGKLVEVRTYTTLSQSLTNRWGQSDNINARWACHAGASFSLFGFTLKISYPGIAPQHHKMPFKFYYGDSTLVLGWYNSLNTHSMVIKFMNHNSTSGGSAVPGTSYVANAEIGSGTVFTQMIKIELDASVSQSLFIGASGAGKITTYSDNLHYPATGFTPQFGEVVEAGLGGDSTTY